LPGRWTQCADLHSFVFCNSAKVEQNKFAVRKEVSCKSPVISEGIQLITYISHGQSRQAPGTCIYSPTVLIDYHLKTLLD
jgi:hypothetical protein